MATHASMLPQYQEAMGNNANYFGWDRLTPDAVSDLKRAIGAGYANPGFGQGQVHQIQNLDPTMRATTFTMKSIKAWPLIPKKESLSTIYEYDIVKEWGGQGGLFTNGGELPALQDALYLRAAQFIKYMAIQKEVKHPLTVVTPAHEDMIIRETKNGTMQLLENIERSLFNGNSQVIPQEWDGMAAQCFADPDFVSQNVIDLEGRHPTEDDIENAATKIIERHGVPDLMFMQPKNLSELGKQYFARQRAMLPPAASSTIGVQVVRQLTSAGVIDFCSDIHIRAGRRGGRKTPPSAALYPTAPPKPASVTAVASAGTSKFNASTAGNYWYGVTALNRFGESGVTLAAAATAVAASEQVLVTPVSGGAGTTGFAIYRSKRNPATAAEALATMQIVRRVGLNEPYIDENYLLPGHGMLYMLQSDEMNWFFAMLAPMLKINLGRIALAERWAQVIYGTPIWAIPQFNVIFLNAPDSNTVAR